MDFQKIDRLLTHSRFWTNGYFGTVRLEALTRIGMSMNEYCSVAPSLGSPANGLKYFIYLSDNALDGLIDTISDGSLPLDVRVGAASLYYKVRYEGGVVSNPGDKRLLRAEKTIEGIIGEAFKEGATVWKSGDYHADKLMRRHCRLLSLLTLYSRYSPDVNMDWKAMLDAQVEEWTGSMTDSGRWRIPSVQQCLMRFAVLARYKNCFSAAYDLMPAYGAYIGSDMEDIAASGTYKEYSLLYDIISEDVCPEDTLSRSETLCGMIRSRDFSSDYPTRTEDIRLLMDSICIENDCRREIFGMSRKLMS